MGMACKASSRVRHLAHSFTWNRMFPFSVSNVRAAVSGVNFSTLGFTRAVAV